MGKHFVSFFKTFLVGLVLATTAYANALPEPEGDVLLTVTGEIGVSNAPDGAASFDRAMLEELGLREVTTSTIWTDGPQVFRGVPLKAIAERLGVSSGTFRAVAVNDYAIEIPFEDVADDAALLALDRNGRPMSVRDKGPIWVIYPYDSAQKFRTETYHARSIWQLVTLDVQP